MSQYPHTDRVVGLFSAHIWEEPTAMLNHPRFCVSLPTTSLATNEASELPISPKLLSRESLEDFCQTHWYHFVLLEDQIRELGAVPPMFWEKRAA